MTQQQIEERGNHALVFFSLILALSITNLVEAWAKLFSFGLHPKNILQPEGFFLISISVLSFQYWWVITTHVLFMGKRFWHFVLGVGENVVHYALTVILKEIYLFPERQANRRPEEHLLFIFHDFGCSLFSIWLRQPAREG